MNGNKKGRFSNRMITIAFFAIVCVPVILFALLLISGIFVIADEEKLYAKELNNPYVDSNFDGWHKETIGDKTIILPKKWEIEVESQTIQILQNGESIAWGTLIKENKDAFQTKEGFLAEIFKTEIMEVHCSNMHSLLGSSFGELYINENEDGCGYYLNLVNNDGSSLFFFFSPDEHQDSELKSKAEAIIYYHHYGSLKTGEKRQGTVL